MDNLFHVLFHALPLSEDMKALSAPLTPMGVTTLIARLSSNTCATGSWG